MRILITGAAGFVGGHLVRHLLAQGDVCFGLGLPGEIFPENIPGISGDISSATDVARALEEFAPDACIHLAGVSSLSAAASLPDLAVRVNVCGTVQILESARRLCPGLRILVVSTAHVYGEAAGAKLLTEDAPLRADSMYAATKMAADEIARLYARRNGMAITVARPVNHIGPGQTREFVIASFAAQLADIVGGRAPAELQTGNLESSRDFVDVRDVVRAYRLLLERGRPGMAYNIASGCPLTVGAALDRLCAIAGVRVRTVIDPARFRPTDASPRLDTTRIRNDTGWRAEIPMEKTLSDVYEEFAAAE